MTEKKEDLEKLQEILSKEQKVIKEINKTFMELGRAENSEEKKLMNIHLNSLKNLLQKTSREASEVLSRISLAKSLQISAKKTPEEHSEKTPEILVKKIPEKPKAKKRTISSIYRRENILKELGVSKLERETLKRLKKTEEKIVKKKLKKPSLYVKTASVFFSKYSKHLVNKKTFSTLKRDLVKANLQFVPSAYISVILLTTLISFFASIFIFSFFLFFNLGGKYLVMRAAEDVSSRIIKIFWILFLVPAGVFLFMCFYPSMERKSAETKINYELPFATIHMSSISGSMLDPSKIFSIIISTGEYPHVSKEFVKLINEINIYGYDLVSALRKVAFDCPSKKLTDLLNGLATTITSGGDLPTFFEKRAQSLLFEHRLEREKYTKSAETFMDIYISVVIAAPMILMLLLMMMKISGLGVSLSTSMITMIMVAGVSMINILFLIFLYLKQPGE
ncbi:MAG: type II secretion system F family protein [archaeon]